MVPSLRYAWSEALRSGKYIQGKRELRSRDNRYCAMGVLFDLIGSPYQKSMPWGSFLNKQTLEPLGVSDKFQYNIARLNDSGMSFDQLADLIDRDADMETEIQLAVDKELLRISKPKANHGLPTADLTISYNTPSWMTSLTQPHPHAHATLGLWV